MSNQDQLPADPVATISPETTTRYQLNGRLAIVARLTWATLLGLSLLVFVVAVIVAGQSLNNTQIYGDMPDVEGTVGNFMRIYVFTLNILGGIPFFVVAVLLFWRKANNGWVMVVSLMLATFGGIYTNSNTYVLFTDNSFWPPIITLLSLVGNWTFIYFLYTVPDGRFANRAIKIMGLAAMLWFTVYTLMGLTILPLILPAWLVYLLSVASYAGPVWGQNVHLAQLDEAQGQQVKWIMFGLGIALVGFMVHFLPAALVPALQEGQIGLLFSIFSQLLLTLSLASLPIAIGFSMVRYRLWEVDFFINRSLVYGLVVITIGVLMGLTLLLVQSVFVAITGRNQVTVALLMAALVAGITFHPLRHKLQRWIDQHLYNIHVAYEKPRPKPTAVAPAELVEPERRQFGAYEAQRLIGRGGMANVYLGEHPTLHQTVAIKVMLADQAQEADFRTRFEREAQAIASLRHSNIVKLYDFGEADGTYYMVMEYIDGPNLRDYLQKHAPLPLETAVPLLTGIASALDYAHAQGLVHRDIKPSNVMIQQTSLATGQQGQQAILTDFGIVKMVGGSSALTRTGLVGTLDYIAPEQIKDAKDVDGRADLYSLGVMAYEMLTGQRPFAASNPGALLIAHLQQPPADPRILQPHLPASVAQATVRLLAKEPANRYNTAGDFIRDLHG